jgi:FMNH2-dependent dimethyl sulfone monooxygenase
MTQLKKEPLKFAYWVPNVSGGLVISSIEQRTSWDIDYNRKLAQIAEASGFDYALSQIRFTAGYGADNQHESVSFSHALLAATETLRVIAAVLPGPMDAGTARQADRHDQPAHQWPRRHQCRVRLVPWRVRRYRRAMARP